MFQQKPNRMEYMLTFQINIGKTNVGLWQGKINQVETMKETQSHQKLFMVMSMT